MNDNDIIRALECCAYGDGCENCYRTKECDGAEHLIRAVDLVKRQKAKIEWLNGENKAFGEIIKKQDDEIRALRKDLLKREDLEKNFSKEVKQFEKKLAKTVKLERAEAIKEFVERLKEEYRGFDETHHQIFYSSLVACIDNLVKEMVGERK